MKKSILLFLAVSLFLFLGYQNCDAKRSRNFFRTYEVVATTSNSISLKDTYGTVIELDRAPQDYKVGYKVRYDNVRKRLKKYRWQDYEVVDIARNNITLKHKTGDKLTVIRNENDKYKIGDQIRYDSVDKKLQLSSGDAAQWEDYEVVGRTTNSLTIKDKDGEEFVLRGSYSGKYKVGDKIKYDQTNEKIKKRVKKIYGWKDYEIIARTSSSITIKDKDGEEVVLEGRFSSKYKVGDPVKYDAENDKFKKSVKKDNKWQDYVIVKRSNNSLTLKDDAGKVLVLEGSYSSKYKVDDQVKYDTANDKLKKSK
jgi:hypothetical protein